MKKTLKKLLCSLFVISILSCSLCTFASAAVTQSDYLDAYMAALTPKSGGRIVISIDVDAVVDATELGASRIELYASDDNVTFTRVAVLLPSSYPLMLGSGWEYAKDVTTYYGASGWYYYALVDCYAADETGSDTKTYETAIVRAIA